MTLEYDPNESYELLPEGIYTLEIREEPTGRKRESASGNEYISWMFRFNAIDELGKTKKYTEFLVHWNPIFGEIIKVCGYKPGEDGKYHISETDMVGKRFRAEIKHKPNPNNTDEIRAKIVKIEIADDDVPPVAEEDKDTPF